MPPENSAETGLSQDLPPTNRWLPHLADGLLVFLVLLVAGGDPSPGINEPHYLNRLKHYWDPGWVQGDLFLDSPDAHLTVVVLFGWTTLWLPLPAVAWLGRLISWGIIAWAWRRLSWQVTPTLGVAGLSAALWCVGVEWGNLAGEWAVGGFEAKCLAYGFVLAALGSYLRGEWNRVWVFLGVASAFHVLVGGWTVLLLGGCWLVWGRRETPLPRMAPGLLLGGLVALAGLVPPLWMNANIPPDIAAEGARIYVYERLPHHLALLSKGPDWFGNRSSHHILVLFVLTFVTLVARQTAGGQNISKLCRYAWGAVLLSAGGLAIEHLLADDPARAASLLRYYWHRTTDIAAPLATSLAAGATLAYGLQNRKGWAVLGLAIAIFLPTKHYGVRTLDRLQRGLPPADAHLNEYQAWVDVCRWASEETAPHSLFLTPRSSNSFVWRAERPEVFAFKHVPQNADGLVEWWRRMNTIHRRPDAPPDAQYIWYRTLGELGATRLRELADSYGIDYVLSDRRRPVSLPVAYRNGFYVVYDLRPANREPSR